MAYGKFIYTPAATLALDLDGAHCLSLDNAAFNFGSQDFALDGPVYIDPAVADGECWLAAKGTLTLANASGWHWYYKPASRRLGLRLNDGGATPLTVETPDNALPALGNRPWPAIKVDRGGDQVRFLVDGADVGGGSIAAIAGSLNNSELFRVGGYDAATHCHQGLLEFLRVDLGRLLPAVWYEQEWDRLRYGWPRPQMDEDIDFLAYWGFGEILADLSDSAFTLVWQGGGDPAYVTGWPGSEGPIEYLFEENFQRDHETGFLDLDARQRAEDGSQSGYAGARKLFYRLPFKLIPRSQRIVLDAAWASPDLVAFYADADLPRTFWGRVQTPPNWKVQQMERADGEVYLEQA